MLIEDQHHSRGVTADFIQSDIQISHDRDAFQIRGDLLQRLLLSLLGGESDPVCFGFVIVHSMFAGSGDDSNLSLASTRAGEGQG